MTHTDSRSIVDEVLKLITETEGPSENGLEAATIFIQRIIINEKFRCYLQCGAHPDFAKSICRVDGK